MNTQERLAKQTTVSDRLVRATLNLLTNLEYEVTEHETLRELVQTNYPRPEQQQQEVA